MRQQKIFDGAYAILIEDISVSEAADGHFDFISAAFDYIWRCALPNFSWRIILADAAAYNTTHFRRFMASAQPPGNTSADRYAGTLYMYNAAMKTERLMPP